MPADPQGAGAADSMKDEAASSPLRRRATGVPRVRPQDLAERAVNRPGDRRHTERA